MHTSKTRQTAVALFLTVLAVGTAVYSAAANLASVSRANLCVTEGAIEELPGGRLSVSVPKMRAYLNAVTAQQVEAHFTYLGSTGNEARLGSGELRRQFGLKLRAQDACNLVYAMWRVEPESKLVVSIKSNPGSIAARSAVIVATTTSNRNEANLCRSCVPGTPTTCTQK